MRYTNNVKLPIYDEPETDLFNVTDWNIGNENVDTAIDNIELSNINLDKNMTRVKNEQKILFGEIGKLKNVDENINSELLDVKNKININNTNVSNLDIKVSNFETNISNLNSKVVTNEKDISILKDKININEVNINTLNSKVTTNGNNINTLSGKITTNESNINVLNSKIKVNEESINTLSGKITTAEEKINANKTTIENEISNIDQNLKEITDTIFNSNISTPYEGEYITANNTIEAITNDMKIEGKTYQNLANLYPKMPRNEIINAGKYFNDYALTNLVKSNTTYTLFWDINLIIDVNNQNPQLSIGFSDKRGTFIEDFKYCALVGKNGETYYKHKQVFTLPDISNYTGLGIRLPRYGKPLENKVEYKINYLILLEGDYTNKPLPPFIQGIESSGEKEGKILLESCGKNICKVNNFTFTPVALSNETVSQTNKIIIRNIKINSNCTYILSSSVNFMKILASKTKQSNEVLDHNNLYTDTVKKLGGIEISNNVIPKGYNYISITTGGTAPIQQAPIGKKLTITNIQLEEGTTTTAYEPFKNNLLEIPITEPLRSLPNGVKDEITEDGKLIRRIGKVVLNGSENWRLWSNFGVNWVADSEVVNLGYQLITANSKTQTPIISDRFINGGVDTNPLTGNHTYYLKKGEYMHVYYANLQTNQMLGVSINKNKIGVTENNWSKVYHLFKQWLASNPTTVYYQLETPIITQLSVRNINLKTFKGTTHINSNNYIQTKQSCLILTDQKGALYKLIEEISKIKQVLKMREE